MKNIKVTLTKRDLQYVDKLVKKAKRVWNKEKKGFTKKEILYFMNEWKREFYPEEGTKRRKPQTGYRTYKEFVAYTLQRNLANYDTMILLTGAKGTGKSSAAIQFARSWCSLIGKKFSPTKHIAYNNADIMDRIETLDKFEPLIADEAIRFASSEDWNKAENKELKKKLGEIRTKHLFYILCFPLKPAKLEKTYLESYVNYWIDLYARGEGALFVKDMNPSREAWNLKAFEKMGTWNEFSESAHVKLKVAQHPNFWKIVKIPKVPKLVYEKYILVRESNVYQKAEVKSTITTQDLHKSALLLILREIVAKDGSLKFDRVLKSVDAIIGIHITRKELTNIMKDAQDMVEAMK